MLVRACAPAALERLEDARLIGLGDANAGVAHLDLEGVPGAQRGEPHRAARVRELHGVREQVEHYLLKLELVGEHHPEPGLHLELERDTPARRALAHHRERVFEQWFHGDAGEIELHPACLDFREVEDLVDQFEQVPPGVADVPHVLVLTLVQLAKHSFEQHIGEADDGVQRGAQLM